MVPVNPVTIIGEIAIGRGRPLVLIAGPCVIESEAHASELAGRLAAITRRLGVPFIFKASYDKANRTAGTSFRGPGLDEGLRVLAGHVILVIGGQKIVPDFNTGLRRLYEYCFPLEDQRAREAYGVPSGVNNVLVINRATRPGRITAILVNESLGFGAEHDVP